MPEPKQTLIIFTRYPEAGKTKTRLISVLGENGAAELQQKLTEHTLNQVSELEPIRSLNVRIYFSGGNAILMRHWLGNQYSYYPQVSGDLGKRLIAAVEESFTQGIEKAVIIGCDCPDLTSQLMNQAFEKLSDSDLVLGKAVDGGYYLIGLNQCLPELFQGIDWGTNVVLEQTVAIANRLGLTISYLPLLNDIDTPQDLTERGENPFINECD